MRITPFRNITRRLYSQMSAPLKTIDVEITSDTVCPFCYIGYKRIRTAIDKTKAQGIDADFKIRFAPFQLDPTTPKSPGVNKRERYIAKFGGPERVAAMEQAMIERGKGEGINFSYGGQLSSTVDSHRLIEKAYHLKGQEGQLALVEVLFRNYFEEEKDIGSHEVLSSAAEEAKVMNKSEAKAFLESNEMQEEVQKGFMKARQLGISGVPFTILNGEIGISGAQETATFTEVFSKLAKGELEISE